MPGRAFLDTNLFLYLFAGDVPEKQAVVKELLREGVPEGSLVLSTQVMQEFYSVATRKFRKVLSPDDSDRALKRMMEMKVVLIVPDIVLAAVARARGDDINFWDALIVESALSAGCDRLLTEDLQEGRTFGTLRVENPFTAA